MFSQNDIARVIKNENGHQFNIGDIVRIGEIQDSSSEPSIKTEDDNVYVCENLDSTDFYYLGSIEIEAV